MIDRQYTLQTLLDEMKENIAPFKEGMVFETMKSIYPGANISKETKNIKYKGKSFTKPLANNRKAKTQFIKHNSVLGDFFEETTRGDFLKVVSVDGEVAKCVNISLCEDIINKFYKNETIEISVDMIIDGHIKQYRRKVDKFFVK